jgi:hypothetical protein
MLLEGFYGGRWIEITYWEVFILAVLIGAPIVGGVLLHLKDLRTK